MSRNGCRSSALSSRDAPSARSAAATAAAAGPVAWPSSAARPDERQGQARRLFAAGGAQQISAAGALGSLEQGVWEPWSTSLLVHQWHGYGLS
jgi:hypothetical protein